MLNWDSLAYEVDYSCWIGIVVILRRYAITKERFASSHLMKQRRGASASISRCKQSFLVISHEEDHPFLSDI